MLVPASKCNISGYIITKVLGDELQLLMIKTNCRLFKMGLIDAWDELSFFVIRDELSLGMNRQLGRIVTLRYLAHGAP